MNKRDDLEYAIIDFLKENSIAELLDTIRYVLEHNDTSDWTISS